MGQEGIDIESVLVKVIIALVLFFVVIMILAKFAISFGILLLLVAIFGFIISMVAQDDTILMYSVYAGILGLALIFIGSACVSFFEDNAVGQNYSSAVNSVFNWADKTFNENVNINFMPR